MKNKMMLMMAAAVAAGAANAMVVGVSDACRRPQLPDVGYFMDALERAGHVPVTLQYTTNLAHIAEAVGRIDCLLLTGGGDVNPARYGAAVSPKCQVPDDARDAYDYALLDAAVKRRLPVVGICRGEQLLNVYFGGTLWQDLPSEFVPAGGAVRCPHNALPWDGMATNPPAHKVEIRKGTRLAKLIGEDPLAVNSTHHQAVKDLAPGFRVAAAATDGVIEVIEGVRYPAVGIQFHPETAIACDAGHPGFQMDRILKLLSGIKALTALPPVTVDFNAKDLTKLAPGKLKRFSPGQIPFVRDGKALLPICCWAKDKAALRRGRYGYEVGSDHAAARWLASVVKEMTGVEPEVRVYLGDELPAVRKGPAIYVGDRFAPEKLLGADASREEFRVVNDGGSLYFLGKANFAIYDFAERCLGVRQYWEAKDGGRSVIPTSRIDLPKLDYSDLPMYPKREYWPYEGTDWHYVWKCGNSHRVDSVSHVPHNWWKDTNYNYRVTRPEIFELTRKGTRATCPMLCYSNPKTLQTYIERVDAEIAGGPKSGVIAPGTKTVAVAQWDANIDCQCEGCKRLYNEKAGRTGNASPIIWGCFVRQLSDWLAKAHPDYEISFSPYLNTCDLPEGLTFPAKNAECSLCTMPGLALLKDEGVRAHEEKLMRDWAAATGRPVRSWDYICWPAEFCSAPYVFGKVAQDHYRRLRPYTVGSFINGTGTPPEKRLFLSAYVWVRSMWNPEFDLGALYDTFAARMFAVGAKPMREIIRMQEDGWMRPWGAGQISNKNIYEISYPRKDVLRMQELFAEAKALAKGDALALRRIAKYEACFTDFFKESEDLANGTALEPTLIQKVASDPAVDGRLDDPAWQAAKAYPFVREMDRERSEPYYPTELRMVWTPNGVTIGYRCTEPFAGDADFRAKCRAKGSLENLDIFIDASGSGDGHYYQIYMSDEGRAEFHTDGPKWDGAGVKTATWFGEKEWSAEIFIPYAALKDFPREQHPAGTTAAGAFWLGNFCRGRHWDAYFPKAQRREGSRPESTRRYTRYSIWNKDPAAFGKLQFVE